MAGAKLCFRGFDTLGAEALAAAAMINPAKQIFPAIAVAPTGKSDNATTGSCALAAVREVRSERPLSALRRRYHNERYAKITRRLISMSHGTIGILDKSRDKFHRPFANELFFGMFRWNKYQRYEEFFFVLPRFRLPKKSYG
ncbi:hypothetical protein PVV74_06780 [Roseovarius sp. SK2]|uniref:hypothetical protein n=1 Tax=Roseovarius TaxID=74030 RepID=UPI00237AF129|nr:hypothetical protein [Roseovarius sp. SK2]MDD9725153.1 hypothetical protein [Roseovarius sp. SK2]